MRSGSGDFPVLSQHLWLGSAEAESTAAALAPKLRKGRDGLQKLLFDVIALEVWWRHSLAVCIKSSGQVFPWAFSSSSGWGSATGSICTSCSGQYCWLLGVH